jgi:hypothetical protein
MGVTANRLLDDFGRKDGNSRVLLEALGKNVKVRILIPKKSYLNPKQIGQFESTTQKISADLKRFANFEIRYFDHPPAHSIFVIDDTCIVGPVFGEIESKDTPALVLKQQSQFAEPYIKTFESEWGKAGNVP